MKPDGRQKHPLMSAYIIPILSNMNQIAITVAFDIMPVFFPHELSLEPVNIQSARVPMASMDNVGSITDHMSLRILRFSLRAVGLWPAKNSREHFLSNVLLCNTVALMFMALVIESFDLYCSWGNLHAVSNNVPNTTTVAIEFLKLMQFVLNRGEILKFNAYTEKKFWKIPYNTEEHRILKRCDRQSLTMVIIYIFFAQCVVCLLCLIPIIEGSGKNISERALPFDLHLDLPLAQTPYYELAFFIEVAGMVSVGLCTTGFGGFLCTINLYTAGQFRILSRKLESSCTDQLMLSHPHSTANCMICSSQRRQNLKMFSNGKVIHQTSSTEGDEGISEIDSSMYINHGIWNARADDSRIVMPAHVKYNFLKNCIKQHQLLLKYMEEVENLSSAVMLAQASGSILKICFSGFQILLIGGASLLWTFQSIQFLVGTSFLFFMYACSSHEIIIESQTIAKAAYESSWYILPYTTEGRACRQSLLIIIARAQKPCILTVGKFAPLSLRTFVSVFNTSVSYFTILRQMNERIDE